MVLFVGTATGDDAGYIVTFYEAFHSGRCRPRHLKLFRRDDDELADLVMGADVIHVAAATPRTCSTCGTDTASTS